MVLIDVLIRWTLTVFMYKSINLHITDDDERKYEGVDCGGNMDLVECSGWTSLGVLIHGSRTTHTQLPHREIYHSRCHRGELHALHTGSASSIGKWKKAASNTSDYERYVLVELSKGAPDSPVTLAVNVTNAYVVAYWNGSQSFLLKDAIHNPFPGTKPPCNLSFSGNYIELQNKGGNRKDIGLGMRPLENAITNLRFSKMDEHIARSLIVVIQMVAEAVRFRYIEHQVNQSITSTKTFRPDYLMLSLENQWGALSKEIQQSNQEGDFSGSVKLTTVDNGPLIVCNVSSAINNSGLAIMLFVTSRGGAGISSPGGPKLKYNFISSIIVTIIFF